MSLARYEPPRRRPARLTGRAPRPREQSILPGQSPGGVVVHVLDRRGRQLVERKTRTKEPADLWDALETDSDGRLFAYGYDGDSGEPLGVVIDEPRRYQK